MEKELGELLTTLRDKNPRVYAQLLHDLSHVIAVDELEGMIDHAKDVEGDDKASDDGIDPRAIAAAEALEEVAQEYRSGKNKIDDNTIGLDVKIRQIKKGE